MATFKVTGESKVRTIKSGKTVDSLFTGDKLQGTKWSHVSTGRTGWNTIMDAPIIEEHIKTERRNMGDGYMRLAIPNFDATKDAKPVNIGGRLMFPDKNGVFTIIDEAVVNKMAAMEEEKREYLEKIIEKCSLSDEICQLVLGMDNRTELIKALGKDQNDGGLITDPFLVEVSALPSSIETYDPTGITYSRAIQRFKQTIKNRLPILQNLTPSSTQNQEA